MKVIRLGDPHLGKVFKTGVPLHRRGERERIQKETLRRSLLSATNNLHICVGDLFDEREVPYEDVLWAVREYKAAAQSNPNSVYVVERGNHDASRTIGEASAYDVFAEALRGTKGIFVLEDKPLEIDQHLIIPWHPFLTAAEMVPVKGHFRSVTGHWDVRDFGGGNPNLIPAKQLAGITADVFTGHEHKPGTIKNDSTGFEIILVGSMLPYAFGEEATPNEYLTMSLKEAEIKGQSGALHDKTVRILLREGEETVTPESIDCRQLVFQRVGKDDDTESLAVEVGDFDMETLWKESARECGVNEDTEKKVWSVLDA